MTAAGREKNLDLLRFLGLALIILAHVDPPNIIFQLRNFDVPLMVLVSGAVFGLSYRRESFAVYFWKRIKRLLFPTWIFLTGYFAFHAIFGGLPDHKTIIDSYMLLWGIGFIWIIRVFLLVAAAAPFIYRWNERVQSDGKFFAGLGALYLVYEAIWYFAGWWLSAKGGLAVEDTIPYIFPYSILFAIGLRLPKLSPRRVGVLAAAVALIFIGTAAILTILSGKFTAIQDFKYPPLSYYLSYGLFMSCLAWIAAPAAANLCARLRVMKPVLFVAQNTIWIYLWHIAFLHVFRLPGIVRYPAIFGVAAIIVWAQVNFIERLVLPNIRSPSLQKNIRLVLTG